MPFDSQFRPHSTCQRWNQSYLPVQWSDLFLSVEAWLISQSSCVISPLRDNLPWRHLPRQCLPICIQVIEKLASVPYYWLDSQQGAPARWKIRGPASDLIGWPKWAVWYNMGGESCYDTSKGQPLEIAMATSLPHHDIATEGKITVCGLLGCFMICLIHWDTEKIRKRNMFELELWLIACKMYHNRVET